MSIPAGSDQFETESVRLLQTILENQNHFAERLRFIEENQALILEALIPPDDETLNDGPSLSDLMAKMVSTLQDHTLVLKRIDYTTGVTLDVVEGRVTRQVQESRDPVAS